MDRKWQGKREDGTWDTFLWSEHSEPSLAETGYLEVELAEEDDMDDNSAD